MRLTEAQIRLLTKLKNQLRGMAVVDGEDKDALFSILWQTPALVSDVYDLGRGDLTAMITTEGRRALETARQP